MNAPQPEAAGSGGVAPEAVTEPPVGIEEPLASSALSQVPLNSQALPS